jgi:hypothetical protein
MGLTSSHASAAQNREGANAEAVPAPTAGLVDSERIATALNDECATYSRDLIRSANRSAWTTKVRISPTDQRVLPTEPDEARRQKYCAGTDL